ncbi:hypothetical protein B0H11DRAFT_2045384 [Mycena galericulata]|nr:hypothetical protein B0H11DRAFT_2045384 [Mycena galericulata]
MPSVSTELVLSLVTDPGPYQSQYVLRSNRKQSETCIALPKISTLILRFRVSAMAINFPLPGHPQETFGLLFDGFVLSMIGYGFTFFQTYAYFLQYPSDHWGQKTYVALIFAIETVSATLISKSTYFYLLTSLPYTEGLSEIVPSLTSHILLSALTMSSVQLYCSFQIWKLSNNIAVTGITILLSISGFSLGLAMAVMVYKDPVFTHLVFVPLRVVSSLACTFITLASLSIFIALTWFSRKSLASRPLLLKEWFNNVSLYLFSRGLIVMIVQLATLVTLVSLVHTIYWIPLYLVATKVSFNSLLHMLNSRPSFRGKGINEDGSNIGHHGQSSRSRVRNSTNGAMHFTTVSNMFNAAPDPSGPIIESTRTIQFEQTVEEGSDLDKGVHGSDYVVHSTP